MQVDVTVATPGPGGKLVCSDGSVIVRTPVVGTSTFAGCVALAVPLVAEGGASLLRESQETAPSKMTVAAARRVCFIGILSSISQCDTAVPAVLGSSFFTKRAHFEF